MRQSESINELAKALIKAQTEIKPAAKDATNPFHKSRYADLYSVSVACMPALLANGIAVIQPIDYTDCGKDQVIIITRLIHSSGQWMESALRMTSKAADPQGLGSAITYGRRYSLAAMVGVCPEDDDAESAMQRNQDRPKAQPKVEAASQAGDAGALAEFTSFVNKACIQHGLNFDEVVKAMGVEDISLVHPGDRKFFCERVLKYCSVNSKTKKSA